MELNAEINRVVGEQMAVLLADKISEEELEKAGREAWKKLTERPYSYGKESLSMLDKMIQERIASKVLEKVDELLKEPEPAEKIKKEAERIITEAKTRTHEMIVNKITGAYMDSLFMSDIRAYAIERGCNEIASSIATAINNHH